MGWKIYFWFILVLAVLSYPVLIATKFNPWILIDIVLWIITFMGLYSYAYKKKILNEKFWRIWLFVIIPWDVASSLIIFNIESSITEKLINWSFVIPAYIALFLLGFKSQSLWEGELMKMNDQEKKYDGIGRIAFLAIFLGFPFFIGAFVATLAQMFPDVSEEFISVLSILIMVLFAIVLFVAAVLRMKNIGYSQWWGVLMLVPGINGFFLIYCFVVPEGYADRKSSYGVFVRKLIPIAIIIIIISPFIIIFVPQELFPDFLKRPDPFGRAQVMKGLDRALHIKKAVVDYWVKEQKFPRNNSEAGVSSPNFFNTHTDVIQSITVEEGGIITILYHDRNENIGIGNKTIMLKPVIVNSEIIWDCTGGTVPLRLRSHNCRK